MTDAKMFDGYADAYDQWFMTNSNVFASELKLLHRALHDIEKETILSIGCGSGLFESALHRQFGIQVKYGVEPSNDMATIARKRGMTVKIGDAERTSLSKEAYDVIYLNGCSSYIKDLSSAYQNCHHALKKGGHLILLDVPVESAYGILYKFADIYAQLFAKISDKASKDFFLGQIDFIFNHEVGAHHILAKAVGRDYHDFIADKAWYPSSDHYIKHMYYQLSQDNPAYILSAMLPCLWIYQQVAKKALETGKVTSDNPFKSWFEFYAADEATACLPTYFDLLKRFSSQLPEEKKMIRVFLESCQHYRRNFPNGN